MKSAIERLLEVVNNEGSDVTIDDVELVDGVDIQYGMYYMVDTAGGFVTVESCEKAEYDSVMHDYENGNEQDLVLGEAGVIMSEETMWIHLIESE